MRHGKKIRPVTRIVIFIIGMTLAVFLLLYSFVWAEFPIQVTALGYNVTNIFMACMIVLLGIVAGTLIKSGVLGVWRLD